ncbi:MAG TPA: hypothetical protein VIX41_04425 [Acidimicrobiales bacterium]
MKVDPVAHAHAVDRLRTLGGLSHDRATALVDAMVDGAVDHAFELVNGSGPVPTSMTTSKADQLRWICERLGRLVTQREVEILFRITPTSARTILNTMLATYEEGLHEQFLARMRDDATVVPSGTEDAGLTWTLRFTEASTYEAAMSELARLDLHRQSEAQASQHRITVPRVAATGGRKVDVLAALGL